MVPTATPHLHALHLRVTAFLLMVPEQLGDCVLMKAFFFFYQPRNPWESISFEFQSNKRKYVLGTTGSRIISILIQSSFGNAETHIRLCIVSYFLPLSLNHG